MRHGLAYLAVAGLAACGLVAVGLSATGEAAAEDATYLWSVSAESGVIVTHGGETTDSTLTLMMLGVKDYATQFADRPVRDAYLISTHDLAARWDAWFAGDPPNAALTYALPGDPMPHTVVLELTDPVYDESIPGLAFTARQLPLTADKHADAREDVMIEEDRVPAVFLAASLFIDSFPVPTDPSAVDAVSQANTKVLGDAPAVALGNLYQATAQAIGLALQNATVAQQNATNMSGQPGSSSLGQAYSADPLSGGPLDATQQQALAFAQRLSTR